MSLRDACSLRDCKELKKMIVENPELPLLVFVSDEANTGDSGYVESYNITAEVKALTLYGDTWLNEDDYAEKLGDNFCDDEKYKNLSDKEFNEMIGKKVSETEFIKAICVYVD